jgi:hypothetical protein
MNTKNKITQEKTVAPGEDRTHGLQIMRLTRCLLRYQGWVIGCVATLFFKFFYIVAFGKALSYDNQV